MRLLSGAFPHLLECGTLLLRSEALPLRVGVLVQASGSLVGAHGLRVLFDLLLGVRLLERQVLVVELRDVHHLVPRVHEGNRDDVAAFRERQLG